ncbi:hypothetical protein [Mariniphaga sp.]|uniref:hypothetical protein n=1 Tax=Mariniphaga sp. TaxID=1954475 RepID=UPI00356140CA
MFTIGIFTTHLPYIAFVVFYAFFLLFGVNKASSGEIEWGENNLVLKVPAGESNGSDSAESLNYHYHQGAGIFSPGTNEHSAFTETIQHTSYPPENTRKWYFSQALFSRPPPVLS